MNVLSLPHFLEGPCQIPKVVALFHQQTSYQKETADECSASANAIAKIDSVV